MAYYKAPPIPAYRIDSPPDSFSVFSWVPNGAEVYSIASHITQLDMRGSSPLFLNTAIHPALTHLAINRLIDGTCIPETVEHLFIRNYDESSALPPVKNIYFCGLNIDRSGPLVLEHSIYSWDTATILTASDPHEHDLIGEPMTAFGSTIWVAKYVPNVKPQEPVEPNAVVG